MSNGRNAGTQPILAIDLGGSKALSALVSVSYAEGGLRRAELSGVSRRVLSKESGKQGVRDAIESAVAETLSKTNVPIAEIAAIGATIPGVADPLRGYWTYAPFSGVADFPIADELRARYGKPVFADNDVNACAWAERVFGVCQGVDDFLWITISNGIGGGLVLNGRVYPGKHSGAAEIGHFNVVENGALCGCGNRGCLEATAAGPGIARSYREFVESALLEGSSTDSELAESWFEYLSQSRSVAKTLLDLESVRQEASTATAETIAAEARRGNPLAQQTYRDVGRHVGRAASWAANLINPDKIVIGGGVSGAFDLFYPSLWETFQSCLFKQTNGELTVEKTGLGYEAGLFGAASLACDNPYQLDGR